MPDHDQTQHLFAYGTLQTEAVQLYVFGRTLEGEPDTLIGYRLLVADHRNLKFTGNPSDIVEGTVFTVTKSELEQVDAYEPARYQRTLVQLRSGIHAWVYLNASPEHT